MYNPAWNGKWLHLVERVTVHWRGENLSEDRGGRPRERCRCRCSWDRLASQTYAATATTCLMEMGNCIKKGTLHTLKFCCHFWLKSMMGPNKHSHLQSFARPSLRIAKGDEQVIRHTDRWPPWTALLRITQKQSYMSCIVSHSWSGLSQEKIHI